MQELRIPASEWAEDVVTPVGPADTSEARMFVNRLLFRGMLFTCGSIAVGLHQVNREAAWRFAKRSARALGVATGVEVKVFGEKNLPEEPSIITPNHASHFDIASLLGHLRGHNRFAAKQELFREPILGMVMSTLGMIPIDREDTVKSIERLSRLEARGSGAFSLIMFPEGTRSEEGRLLPFKTGAFVLAIQLQRPVVPIAIHGSSGVMPRGKYLSIRPGTVVMEVLPAISTKGLTLEDRGDLRDRVRAQIAQRLARATEANVSTSR
jgi:1-acyl-sn-glycerol-3-phosphate acyltransferase